MVTVLFHTVDKISDPLKSIWTVVGTYLSGVATVCSGEMLSPTLHY